MSAVARLEGPGFSRVMAWRALTAAPRLAGGSNASVLGASSSSNSSRPATGRVASGVTRPAGALRGSAFRGARVPGGAPRLVRAAGRVQAGRTAPSLLHPSPPTPCANAVFVPAITRISGVSQKLQCLYSDGMRAYDPIARPPPQPQPRSGTRTPYRKVRSLQRASPQPTRPHR